MAVEVISQEKSISGETVRHYILWCFGFLKEWKVIPPKTEMELSVAVISPDKIQEINKQYRDVDEPTDVLSFAYDKEYNIIEGELFLCPSVIEKYAKEDGKDYEKELKKNIVHGLLHILGYAHGKEMFALQDRLLQQSSPVVILN